MSTRKYRSCTLFTLLLAFFLGAVAPLLQADEKKPVLEKKNMDLSIKPGDDFYRYANGQWIKGAVLPADRSQFNTFTEVRMQNQERLHNLFEALAQEALKAPKDSPVQKIGDFYATAMDTESIEALGAKPLTGDMNKIAAVKNLSGLVRLLADFTKKGSNPLFGAGVEIDLKNSEIYSFYIDQGGLSLPETEYYTRQGEDADKIRKEFVAHVEAMLVLLGETPEQAALHAETVMKIETRLAKSSKNNVEQRDLKGLYNKLSLADIEKTAPNFDWKTYLKAIGAPQVKEIIVTSPKFIAEVSAMLKDVPMADWKVYLKWHTLHGSSAFLSTPFVDENFRFFGKVMQGTEKNQDRWKRMTDVTSGTLGDLVGQIYVERYFPPEAKKRMETLVANLKKAFSGRLEKLEWMSGTTKAQALEKLAAMQIEVGYPSKWKDYTALHLDRSTFLSNMEAFSRFAVKRNMEKLGKPVDKNEWGMTPQTVNASYNILQNKIIFPAGILQPPFFFADADDAVNYGAIGMVIGHEMSHGFDDQGRNFDKEGNMRDWWTKEDAEKFKEQSELLVKQYEGFSTADGVHVNGRLSLGENIADYAGLTVAFDAYNLTLEGKPEPEAIDGFSGSQRFFLANAQIWRGLIRDEALKRLIQEDVHPWGEFRVNGAPFNVDAFYKAFNIQAGDKLYRTPDQRPKIW